VTFTPDNVTATVEKGTDLLTAATKAGVYIKSTCGGEGTCGRCRVRVIKGNVLKTEESFGNIPRDYRSSGYVLACKTYVDDDLVIEIPNETRMEKHQVLMDEKDSKLLEEAELNLLNGYKLNPISQKYYLELDAPTLNENAGDFERLKAGLGKEYNLSNLRMEIDELKNLAHELRSGDWKVTATVSKNECKNEIVRIEREKNEKNCYGLAVDIGTTTVVVSLMDLKKGCSIDRLGSYNKQARYGDDVISRMIYVNDHGVEKLQNAIIDTINDLIDKLLIKHDLKQEDVTIMTTAGNTVMAHLFLGLDTKYIRLEPYIPTASKLPVVKAKSIGVNINPNAPIYSFPAVASYVGGDIVSGCLAVGINKKEDLTLFIDIGTNGEIVLGNNDWLISCACSAGPAFEGGGITYGTRAMEGAIERVFIEPETLSIKVSTIGEKKAVGICGSGLIDLISEMYKAGIIDRAGQFIRSDSPYIKISDSEKEYVLVSKYQSGIKKDIVITENDVKNLIRSKGAVFAGVRSLLKTMQMELDMIDKILIAGGFGNYLNIDEAIKIGLLPDLPHDKFEFVGNTSLKGAELVLLSDEALQEVDRVGTMMTYLELSVGNLFMDEFMSSLFLPHTDLTLFPSVAK
jgi:uncharacterized 2Fe-2S/4Fe-4S cluster protein (DUF4445 family)